MITKKFMNSDDNVYWLERFKNIKDNTTQVQGKITLSQLKLLGIKYEIFDKRRFSKQLNYLILANKNNQPVAFIFKKGDLNSLKDKRKDQC